MTKALEIKKRFCISRDWNCFHCPFNHEEYSYNEYDEEGDYWDMCDLEERGAEEALQKLFDLYEEYKDKPVVDVHAWEPEDYFDEVKK